MSSSLALKKNASVQNRCKGEKVNVPYASEKGSLVGKERALNEIKNTAAESRGDIRKRRRKRSAFAGFAASKPLDNHRGCRGGASREEPGGFFDRPGRSAKQGGRTIDAPAARAPGFWMQKVRKGAWWLARPFEHFVRQNPKAEPSLSCATPAKLRCLLLEYPNTIEPKAFRRLSSSGCDALAFCGK